MKRPPLLLATVLLMAFACGIVRYGPVGLLQHLGAVLLVIWYMAHLLPTIVFVDLFGGYDGPRGWLFWGGVLEIGIIGLPIVVAVTRHRRPRAGR